MYNTSDPCTTLQYVDGATNVKNCQMMCEHHVNNCETFPFENKAKYHKTFICGNNKIKEKKIWVVCIDERIKERFFNVETIT